MSRRSSAGICLLSHSRIVALAGLLGTQADLPLGFSTPFWLTLACAGCACPFWLLISPRQWPAGSRVFLLVALAGPHRPALRLEVANTTWPDIALNT